ncbi:hypothetical protein JZ751_017007 [Albula glossodonta]|uniref:Uncharacterized protein n=1 Tax=Albula glossodonta TaxID=121402 RepID=A0A8T2MU21_9TELE|nr:hypothetical protein JZ751_017007 [Albula glossodonta]
MTTDPADPSVFNNFKEAALHYAHHPALATLFIVVLRPDSDLGMAVSSAQALPLLLKQCCDAADRPQLQGLGNSKAAVAPAAVGELAPGGFLKQVLEALQLGPAVVISPSLSGMYSLPLLFQHGSLVRAYIPVAPICTEKFTAEQYGSIQTPSLIVYGDQDTQLGEVSLNNLKNLANHKVVVMKGAGHPCYLDNPAEWHKAVLEFLQTL